MKSKLVSLVLIAALIMAVAIPTSALAITEYYVKTNQGGPIGVWESTDTHSQKLGSLAYGEIVPVEGILGNGWAQIVWGGAGSAFVHSKYLVKSNPGKFVPKGDGAASQGGGINYKKFTPAYYKVMVVPTSTFVNLRWSPSKDSAGNIQDRLFYGQMLWVLANNGSWSQVYDAENHRGGFVQSSFLVPAE